MQGGKRLDRVYAGYYGSTTWGRGGCQEGFLEEVTFKLRPKGQVGVNQVKGSR